MEAGEVTLLLSEIKDGNTIARNKLLALLYPKLKELATARIIRDRAQSLIQPTVLLHEAIVKIASGYAFTAQNRIGFLALMGHTMHSVLVDHARRLRHTDLILDQVVLEFENTEKLELIALDEALTDLKELDPRKHDVVVLHFFAGLKFKEIANHLSVSISTIEKDWRFARAWLRKRLDEEQGVAA